MNVMTMEEIEQEVDSVIQLIKQLSEQTTLDKDHLYRTVLIKLYKDKEELRTKNNTY